MIAIFIIMPLLIKKIIVIENMWQIFVPVALVGTIFMAIFSRIADILGTKKVAAFALFLELVGLIIPIFSTALIPLLISFVFIYAGFCILSPILPAAISRFPSHNLKGTVMSFFHTFRSIGTALGGFIGGTLSGLNPQYLFISLTISVTIALIILRKFDNFENLTRKG